MIKIIFIFIVISLFSYSNNRYVIEEEYFYNSDNYSIIRIRNIENDSIYFFLQKSNKIDSLKKIKINDTLEIDLKFEKFKETDSQITYTKGFYYNSKKYLIYVDSSLLNGYLPDSCFIFK